MRQVPQFDFANLNFAAGLIAYPLAHTNHTFWQWEAPSLPLQQLASTVANVGSILPITPPAPNSTWNLDFWGPTLQCDNLAAAEQDAIWTSIWNAIPYPAWNNGSIVYLSWTPWPNTSLISDSPSDSGSDIPFLFPTEPEMLSFQGPSKLSVPPGRPLSLLITSLPEMQNFIPSPYQDGVFFNYQNFTGNSTAGCLFQNATNLSTPIIGCDMGSTTFTPALLFESATLLRCDLLNTSYSVDFSYSNGLQDVTININTTGNSPQVIGSKTFAGPSPPGLFNNTDAANCSTFQANTDSLYNFTSCVFDLDAMRLVSYQGIMAAFNDIVNGNLAYTGASVISETDVMTTVLGNTDQLAFIRDLNQGVIDSNLDTLQTFISGNAGWAYPGLANATLPKTQEDLKSTLEQLFQNLTISLLTESYLQ
jgi:hypothetical protein